MRSRIFLILAVLCGFQSGVSEVLAGAADQRLDLYFIDVEGGAAMLLVSPSGESVLIDSGYPDNMGRDRDRILNVVKNVAKLTKIDHVVVSHWHMDHYGNHAALAAMIPIGSFWDRGIPDTLADDKQFLERIAQYRAASQNESKTLKAGDTFEIDGPVAPLKVKVLTASRDVIPNTGTPNLFAEENQPKPEDKSDNAASVSFLFEQGNFRFVCCGDLTWNTEAKLMTPNNPVGQIDLFMVTHHGLGVSNNPVLVKALDPVVNVMCNGPAKGGDPNVIKTVRSCKSFQALYQLHRNLSATAEQQAPAAYIANDGDTTDCQGTWIKASVAPDGNSYTVQIGPDGKAQTYSVRATTK